MKRWLSEYWFIPLIFIGIGMVIWAVYHGASSHAADVWLAKPWTKATMKDVLATGGILVTLHAIMSRD